MSAARIHAAFATTSAAQHQSNTKSLESAKGSEGASCLVLVFNFEALVFETEMVFAIAGAQNLLGFRIEVDL